MNATAYRVVSANDTKSYQDLVNVMAVPVTESVRK